MNWVIKNQDQQTIENLKAFGFDETIAQLLFNRGIKTPKEAKEFCEAESLPLFSPSLLPDIKIAGQIIEEAIRTGKKITIYGDYDVDGVTSVTAMILFFRKRGVEVDYYIPDRKEEGYGLSTFAIDKIKEKGTELIITVDTGSTAKEEVEYIKSLGLSVVVTDHHECSCELPDCPVINPKRADSEYPFKDLAGVGVVFKLISYLEEKEDFVTYGTLATLGTIADIMPLVSENRRIVYEGIRNLNQRASVGISALLSFSGCDGEIDSSTIAFRISPRMNAVGRMSRAESAIRLLLAKTQSEAEHYAQILCSANEERQNTERRILASVESRLSENNRNNIIIEGDEGWHNGVIGIVASRLVEKYQKPAILFCFDGKKAKGSARSVEGVSIYDMISSAQNYTEKFGGHEMAAGLTVLRENYEDFRSFLFDYAKTHIKREVFCRSVVSECVLPQEKLNLDFYNTLSRLEPFGSANPIPTFLVEGVTVLSVVGVSQNKHTRLTLKKDNGESFTAMYFSYAPESLCLQKGDKIDLSVQLSKNTFRGQTDLSVLIKAIRFSDNREIPREENAKISKDDVTVTYRLLKRFEAEKPRLFSLGFLSKVAKMSHEKFRLCLNVLSELSLITLAKSETAGVSGEELYIIKTPLNVKKTQLENSETFINRGINCGK